MWFLFDFVVVGVIKDYKAYGKSKVWRENDRSNRITVYHHSGLLTEYLHLTYNGTLVSLGDFVKRGQPIGLSGMTGFTTGPHLHFDVKILSANGLISTDIEFENGIHGSDLLKNKSISH